MTLDEFDFTQINGVLEEIFQGGKLSFLEIVEKLMEGELAFSIDVILSFVKEQIFYEISASRNSLIHILLLVIIAAVFSNFSGLFKSTQISEISFSMVYLLTITICLSNFRILASEASKHVGQLTHFMEVLGPVYFLSVAAATGSATSVSFYQIVLLVIYLVETVILQFLIPFVQIYLIIQILSEFSLELQLSKFAELIGTVVSWTLKTLIAGVIGLNLIQRILSPAIDSIKRGLLIRGGETIPVIGDVTAGAAEIVLSTAVLIKNGIGVAGMVISLMIILVPLIQVTIITFMYQIISALVQPISDKRMVNCIAGMAESTKMLLKIIFATGILFMVTIAVVATTTGGV